MHWLCWQACRAWRAALCSRARSAGSCWACVLAGAAGCALTDARAQAFWQAVAALLETGLGFTVLLNQ